MASARDLANDANRRFRGKEPLTDAPKRLVFLTRATSKKLDTLADKVKEIVGFRVWPNQIAALLVERGLGK